MAVTAAVHSQNESLAEELDSFVSIASFRTIEQDLAFGIRQLVDISLKALSPGVNDTTTAVTCLHYLGSILHRITGREIPGEVCRTDGNVRVIARLHTYAFLVDEAFNQIRQDAKGNVTIHLVMLDTLETAATASCAPSRRQILLGHVDRVLQSANDHVACATERALIQARAAEVTSTLRLAK